MPGQGPANPNPSPELAEQLNAALSRIEQLEAQVAGLMGNISAYADSFSLLIAVWTLLLSLTLGLSGYMVIVTRRQEKVADRLQQSIGDLEGSRDKYMLDFDARIKELQSKISEFDKDVLDQVVAKSGLLREFISGEVLYRNSDYQGAIRHLLIAHQADPTNVEVAYKLGRAYTNMNQITDAEAIFERLLKDNPENAFAKRGLALATRFSAGDRARSTAKSALMQSDIPNDLRHDLHNEYALLLRDNGDRPGCLHNHLLAEKLKHGDAVTQYFIGIAQYLNNDEVRGAEFVDASRAQAKIELADGLLRPLWGSVIFWSAATLVDDDACASEEIAKIRSELKGVGAYLTETVRSHISVVCSVKAKPMPKIA